MDQLTKPFCPGSIAERYLLLASLYHSCATRTTLTAIMGEPAAPVIKLLRKRGLRIRNRGGGYAVDDDDRKRVIDGMRLSDV